MLPEGTRIKRSLLLLLLIAAVACGQRRLTPADALKAVAAEPDASRASIQISDISQADGAVEATALSSADGVQLHLKFRQYEGGWKWESTDFETSTLTPSATVAVLIERARKKKVSAWASPLLNYYATTADTIHWLRGDLDRKPGERVSQETWDARHQWLLGALESSHQTDPLSRLRPPVDAWGLKLEIALGGHKAIVASWGPDGMRGTSDDIFCVFTGRLEWDSSESREMWNYYGEWHVPEGLDAAVEEFLIPTGTDTLSIVT